MNRGSANGYRLPPTVDFPRRFKYARVVDGDDATTLPHPVARSNDHPSVDDHGPTMPMNRPQRRPLGRALDAIEHPCRRRLLLALDSCSSEVTDGVDAESVVPTADDSDEVVISLVHVHLPKLSAYGYVRWDGETTRVRRGSDFEEVVPLVRLLHDNRVALPYEWP